MNIEIAMQLILALLNRMAQIGAMIAKARAEGRDISDAELDGLRAADDTAKLKLQQHIDAARSAGAAP